MNTANESYRYLLETVMLSKSIVSPRNQATREYLGFQTKVDMQYPIVTIPSRQLNHKFMVAEAYWILKGLQGLDELTPYCQRMAQFSDDGRTLSGAYGPRFLSQVRYVTDILSAQPDTRQAVMTLWERNPRPSRDIPCTVSLQWLLRDNKLHCIAFMRSSDCWLGWPYDVFSFSMMSAYVLLQMQNTGAGNDYELGTLRILAGSQHIYARDEPKVINLLASSDNGDIQPITLHGILTPDDLCASLGDIRNTQKDNILDHIQQQLCRSK